LIIFESTDNAMDKILISHDLNSGKYFVLIIGFILAIILFINYNNKEITLPTFLFLAISAVLYYLLSKAKKVEFDEKNMTITLNTSIEIIPLTDVRTIKLTMIKINNQSLWKINYTDCNGIEQSVSILPIFKDFEIFKENVRKNNPNVEIKNWSHSLDFDQ